MKNNKISIIVPVYNRNKEMITLLDSLLCIDYPKEFYEIIVIDNNSIDGTKEVIKNYPVRLLEENNIQSSYAARNKGIKNAKYGILAFIDSDCIADKDWLKEGIKPIIGGKADIVGGNVEFYFSDKKTAAELYDSIVNMQIEQNIKERSVAKTANLFVKAELFKKIGLFPDNVKSGGDVQWTARATRKGFSIVYAPKAIVKHPARKLNFLLKKQLQVGKGMAFVLKNDGKSLFKIIYRAFIYFMPPKISSIINRMSNRNENYKRGIMIFKIWFVAYLCKLSMGLGIIFACLNYFRRT